MSEATEDRSPVRYAVVGLGWFAQAAALPAIENAGRGSKIAAFVSSDDDKLARLGERYGVPPERRVGYDGYDDLLASGAVDAVYVALPNHLHREYAVRAAEAGVHVLCEKPLAVTEADCRAMIAAAEAGGVKLMTAYRLHFEAMTLAAIEIVRSGRIGEPRLFDAVFSNPLTKSRDSRFGPVEDGGGTVADIGVYCINAARSLFGAEPEAVAAFSASGDDPRFRASDEMTSAILRFPGARLATFSTSFGAASRNAYRVIGTEGDLAAEPAFDFEGRDLRLRVTVDGETSERVFPERDQIAGEVRYFSRCVREDREPEPNGWEGLADVRVVSAVNESARRGGAPIALAPFDRAAHPSPDQEEHVPPRARREELVSTEPP